MEGMQVFMVSEPKKRGWSRCFRGGCSYRQIDLEIGQTTYRVEFDGMVADFDSSSRCRMFLPVKTVKVAARINTCSLPMARK